MMVGNNLKDTQLQQIVDKTICFADKDEDGKISFEEFCSVSCSRSQFLDTVLMSRFLLHDEYRSSETQIFIRRWLLMFDLSSH